MQATDTSRDPSHHSDGLPTAADPAAATNAATSLPSEDARLIVYYGEGADCRTRILQVPDGAEVAFGRSRGATVCIESDLVSRRHARLARRAGAITIQDLHSRNGTRVNGRRVRGEVTLQSGDEITVGPVKAVLSITTRVPRSALLAPTSYLDERLTAEVDRAQRFKRPFALVMMRLEGESRAVQASVSRIADLLRPMDAIAEYGPDELAVLLPEVGVNALREVAERLVVAAHHPRPGDTVIARVGAAAFPDDGTQPGLLVARARAALREARVENREVVARPPEDAVPGASDLVVRDPQMRRVFELARKVADTGMTVLLTGETGCGKEVLAEEIHRASRRSDQRFLRVNCATIPETLQESELFGHEKGAFTTAHQRKKGYFEAADGGTLFLDEIGEISAGLQAKLLRVLEERRFTRVGGTDEIEVDVRVVCATNRDLEEEVKRGAFRSDLFFRISAFTVLLPPLRDRAVDVCPLAELFARMAADDLGMPTPIISVPAQQMLERYSWPGNVRELRNAVERAIVLQSNGVIGVEHLPDRVRECGGRVVNGSQTVTFGADVRGRLAEVERVAIVSALEACGGNQTQAAKRLGLSRRALIYKMEKYGLKPPPRRQTEAP